MDADRTFYEHEHITPLAWWAKTLGKLLAADCVLAGLGYFVVRWFVMGVRPEFDGDHSEDI
jgi:hypothetical protein